MYRTCINSNSTDNWRHSTNEVSPHETGDETVFGELCMFRRFHMLSSRLLSAALEVNKCIMFGYLNSHSTYFSISIAHSENLQASLRCCLA